MGKIFAFGTIVTTAAVAVLIGVQTTWSLVWPEVALGESLELRAASAEAFFLPKHAETVAFVGDVLLARDVEVLMNRFGDDYPLRGIDLRHYGVVVGNFEAAIPPAHVPTPAFVTQFSVASSAVLTLASAGFTHFSLANNHSTDYGSEGYTNTSAVLQSNKLTTFGHSDRFDQSSISYFEKAGLTYALIGIHTNFSQPTTEQVARVMAIASAQSDVQIAYIHWGQEYQLTHSTAQRAFAEQLVTAGVDLVIGHHPHVVQDIELIEGVPVVYSLGNYIFDQYFSTDVQQGLVVELDTEGETHTLTLVPVTSIGSRTQPQVMPEYERSVFLQSLAERSDASLRSAIRTGVITF